MVKPKISRLAVSLTAQTPFVSCRAKRCCKRQESPRKIARGRWVFCLLLLGLLGSPAIRTFAQSAPLDVWSSDTQLRIRDRNTLNYSITARTGYFEVYFDSNNNATWADAVPPYAIHTGGHISTGIWRVRWSAGPILRSSSVTVTMVMAARKRRWRWRRLDTSHSRSTDRGRGSQPDRRTQNRDGFRSKRPSTCRPLT